VYRSGSFIGISFVFITGLLDAENDAFKFHFTTTKKKLKRNERRAKRALL